MIDFELIPAYDNKIKPEYKTKYSSGIDLEAYLNMEDRAEVCLWSMEWNSDTGTHTYYRNIAPHTLAVINTGLKINFNNKNLEGQIRSRSGLAINSGLFVLNAPGTIDADYEGIIKVILFNPNNYICGINEGDRIAQLVICPIVKNENYIKHEIRGTGGFGSTDARN